MASDYDFIAIGDIVTDAFIRLKEATVTCEDGDSKCLLCMRFGDKLPYEEVYIVPAVGNSANAAVSAARLGLNSALVTNMGEDKEGGDCLAVLNLEHVGTDFVTRHAEHKTNYHYVLWYGDERTILVKHEKFDYHLPDIGNPRWVYLSSLGENSLDFHKEIETYMNAHKEIKLVFQPGTFQMRFGTQALAGIYSHTELFFCNKEEAQQILQTQESDIKKLLSMMAGLGPKKVVITDGTKGAYAFDGTQAWFMPPYPDPKPPLQRTGAGDAFSSTFTVALALGLPITEALRWGPVNSMSVVQGIGARQGLLTRQHLEEYLAKAPQDYQPKPL